MTRLKHIFEADTAVALFSIKALARLKHFFDSTAAKGLLGVSSVGSAIAISLANVIQWLQLVSLVLGIAVAAATLISIYHKGNAALKKTILAVLALIIAATLISLLTGCAYYHPSRTVEIVREDGTLYRSKESSPLFTLFKKGEADMVSSQVDDKLEKGYSRKVGIERIQTSSDSNAIDAAGNAVGNAIAP